MRSNNRSFKWLRLRFRRSLAALLAAFMVWPMVLPAISLAVPTAIWTTDVTGTDQDKNGYANGETVYLNGGTDLPEGTLVTYEIKRLPSDVAKTQTIAVDANGDWLAVPIFTPAEYGTWINDSHTEFQVKAFYMEGDQERHVGGDNFYIATPEEPPVEPNPAIRIVKDDAPTVTAGDDSTFTITITNTGDTTLTDVEVKDILPTGLSLDADKTTPAPSASGSTLTWTFASLAPGASEIITLVVNTGSADTYLNTAEVIDISEELSESDSGTLIVNPRRQEPNPAVRIVKDDAPTVTAGDDSTFTITITNTGDTTLTDVEVKDILPTGLSLDADKTTPAPSASGSTLTWTFASLAPGASEIITLVVNTGSADTYLNTAEVIDISEELSESDSGTLIVNPRRQELETSYTITKTDLVDPVIVGDNTTYTITVRNTGETTLTNVSVYDALPAGLEFVSAEPAPYITSPLGWHLPDLGPDADPYIIKVRVKALTVGKWTNSAHVHVGELPAVYAFEDTVVSSQPTTNETTPTPPLAPVVAPATYDLSITKVDDVDPAYVGDTVTYTMTVKNIGDQPLTGLAFRDALPTGLTFKSSSSTTIKQSTPGAFAWSLATLEPGESRKFKISTTANAVGNWKNLVSVTAKELPTAKQAAERTQVLALVAQAPQTIQSDANLGSGGTLPLTGFPLTVWWLTTATMLGAGLWLELTSRRRKRLS